MLSVKEVYSFPTGALSFGTGLRRQCNRSESFRWPHPHNSEVSCHDLLAVTRLVTVAEILLVTSMLLILIADTYNATDWTVC